jgi:[acyl-carrier-protein] S-malonyltransferase
MRTAMVFPGMGPTDFAEVGKFMLVDPEAGRLLAEADEILGWPVFDRLRAAETDYGEAPQVAFLVNCLALAGWARERLGVEPDVCTGASFGERVAAVFSGALDFPAAVTMTVRLVRCVEEYFAEHHRDVVTHSFARADEGELAKVFAEFDEHGHWHDVSCHVDEGFYMVSLREGALEWFKRRLAEIGALSLYTMRPPLHSRLFADLRAKVEREVLGDQAFADPELPIVNDQDGSVVTSAEGVRAMLLDGFVRPVRWPVTAAALRDAGVTTACVAGPDRLFGRVNCMTSNFTVVAAGPRQALSGPKKGA